MEQRTSYERFGRPAVRLYFVVLAVFGVLIWIMDCQATRPARERMARERAAELGK